MKKITREFLMDMGYQFPRQLPDGRWIGVRKMLTTFGLFVGLNEIGNTSRYCCTQEHLADLMIDIATWDGKGDPPGMWIKHKGRGVDTLNPRWLEETKAELIGDK